ncbi:DNA-directed RNA polymerase I subunit RPA1 [Eumeta japonica]|uniref:DNA-directed RNA polymerase subunit n=1 Tax=Eumeta variegata TaxID=151549 RepID=A0A4C1WFS1_EUMVA|nr:DNA-directed RNA polymerase I subunit RPA1 [Eumeta japonica]
MAFSGGYTSNTSGFPTVDPSDIQFLLYSNEDIRRLSVVNVKTINSFDALGNVNKGGLYDSAMGPLRDRNELCTTCSNTLLHCPGHFGHIELPFVVINPLFIKTIYTMFRISCLKCFRIQMNDNVQLIIKLQLQLLEAGHVTAALDLETLISDVDKNANSADSPAKPPKFIKKYKKLLKEESPVVELFNNKNVAVLKSRFLNNLFKTINPAKRCIFCQHKLVKVTTSDNKLMCHVTEGTRGVKVMLADEIQKYCSQICENDSDILVHFIPILQYSQVKPLTDIFFVNVIPIPPPNVRPCNILHDELVEHVQSNLYKNILTYAFNAKVVSQVLSSSDQQKAIDELDQLPRQAYEGINGKSAIEKLHSTWQSLQKSVNFILNCSSELGGLGLKQILEKKAGIIRMHMMGKRVNFAARSVITPDPNVDIDEIGIPEAFATKLTYPVPVTEWNVDELRQMVINGPNVHPGAEKIEMENGRIIRIPTDSIVKRKSLAKRLLTPDELKNSGLKIVHRHLINGDVLILNRQPTLHKPSMMAHRARILKGEKTLRLHYANCKSYNADFDGDEMNAHFPQNEIARSEAYNIMSVKHQYLVPKDGTPLSGLIQDHVISGVKMSLRGTFFNKSDYQQLVFQALSNYKGEIKLLPPAILKPQLLWSGKQVLSTVIINSIPKDKPYLSLSGRAKINAKAWQKYLPRSWKAGGVPFTNPNTMTEAEVIIRKGQLLCGVLDKTHYGATAYGLVHCMYELYGGETSSALLSAFSKLFTYYLQWEGFTLGVKDILVVNEADKKRDEFIDIICSSGKIAASKATELSLDVTEEIIKETIEDMMIKNPKFRASLDRQYKSLLDRHTNNINSVCLGEGLLQKFPDNNLQLMVQSGAKGSTVNTMQISCLLGQIELEGKRPPLMISGKSLPSFPPFDLSPRAGGFIDGRFMTGIQPQEFFFHCMAGREGLIDTAVKTSRSGYLQRCLIKHLEGLSVAYDHTVRDADASVIQFAYGEDGLDVLKCQFLKKNQFEFLDANSTVFPKSTIEMLKEGVDIKTATNRQKSLKKWKKKNGNPMDKTRDSPFTAFSRIAKNDIKNLSNSACNGRDAFYSKLEEMWRSLDLDEQKQYSKKRCPDPITSKASPEYKFGVITEHLDNIMQDYMKNRPVTSYNDFTEKENLIDVIHAKFLGSMATPGEPVGLLAAQSIGEPSTQMTLNTFHFAGRGDMNVTLGIPRLREILMTASAKLKTPSMDIPFLANISDVGKKTERLRLKLNRVTVQDVLEKINITSEIVTKPNRNLKTTMRFCFLPREQYKNQYSVKPKQIIKHMHSKFFKEMFAAIKKQVKTTSGIVWTTEKESTKKHSGDDEEDEEEQLENNVTEPTDIAKDDSSDDDIPNEDDDNTEVKIRKKRDEQQEYEDPESEEEEKSEDEEEMLEEAEEQFKQENENIENMEGEINANDTKTMAEVVENYHSASNYIFDTKRHLWCELTVLFPVSFLKIDLSQALRDAASRSVIHEVKNIRRAITIQNKSGVLLKTEGINIVQMFKFQDLLDLNKLYSNDIHAIANTYGIEAASRVIVKEIQNVFEVYGIVVDPRHLSLVADYMTYNGRFEPMSRKGMESSSSPLQQMSFESSMTFLKEAVLNAKKDGIRSASSCLILGQPCRSGTGSFGLQHFYKHVK